MNHHSTRALLLVFPVVLAACGATPSATSEPSVQVPSDTPESSIPPTSTLPTTATTTATPSLEPAGAPIEGITLNEDEFRLGSEQVQHVIDSYIKPSGANFVALIPTCLSEDWHDTRIDCQYRANAGVSMPSDEDLISAIQRLHAAGLRVMLKPQALVYASGAEHRYGTVGESWSETQWLQWFDSYTAFITRYARLAEENDVDFFVVGNEQNDTTHREDDWRRVIAAVRHEYTGPITYAAVSWMFEASRIRFWDALDYIGTNWYFTAAGDWYFTSAGHACNATAEDMVKAWQPLVRRLEELSQQYGKQVIITEVGPVSAEGNNCGALHWWSCGPYDGEGQAAYYEAFFDSLLHKTWLKGIVIWSLDTDPMQGGPGDIGSTFVGKPAERLVQEAFHGTPLAPVQTPVPIDWIESPSHSVDIYHNGFRNGWMQAVYSPATNAQVDVPVAPKGTKAIRINLHSVGQLDIYPGRLLGLDEYKWIEFDIMFERQVPPLFFVAFARSTPTGDHWSRPVNILSSGYIGSSDVRTGQWYHLRVALIDMGITDEAYTSLHFMATTRGWCAIGISSDVYLNRVRLVAGLPVRDTPTPGNLLE